MDALATVFETIKSVLEMIKAFLADLGINFGEAEEDTEADA